MADVEVHDHGSVVIINIVSDEARAWVLENVEVRQTWGRGIVVEPRYVDHIIDGLRDAGFIVV